MFIDRKLSIEQNKYVGTAALGTLNGEMVWITGVTVHDNGKTEVMFFKASDLKHEDSEKVSVFNLTPEDKEKFEKNEEQ